jgi:hypothetical protein
MVRNPSIIESNYQLVKNIAGERWQGERVLDADLYACHVGEAMRLRARLQAEQKALQREGLADGFFPTLDERIEQIDAFSHEEARQLRALGYSWDSSRKTTLPLAEHQPPSSIDGTAQHTEHGQKRIQAAEQ